MKFSSTFNESVLVAVRYYVTIDKMLARHFYQALDRTINNINRFPKIGRPKTGYRVMPVPGFPYSFCYEIAKDGPIGLVLYHHKEEAPRLK